MFNWSSKTLQKKQESYNRVYKENIYLKFPPKTLRELIIRVLWGMEATYYNEEATKIHCLQNRFRTFRDCYLLAKTYFPGITFEIVYTEIKNIMEEARKLNSINDVFLEWPFMMCPDAGAATFIYGGETIAPEY